MLTEKTKRVIRPHVFNSTVLLAMMYGSETWALAKMEQQRLSEAERAMKRAMLGISLRDHIPNERTRKYSGVTDTVTKIKRNKLRWVDHATRFTDNTWTAIITEQYPQEQKRPFGRPPRRWEDTIVKHFGRTWRRAKLRGNWRTSIDRVVLQNT
ncbi:hypothetical protein AB6A40_003303 [Gnathostoma spinigerum]|uniref:Endonuclease-reverse transcriptase n=1 Tax=Gnathostoma spinigerum TaxID=75299 RepID=A0ABD6EGZ3_9BILA